MLFGVDMDAHLAKLVRVGAGRHADVAREGCLHRFHAVPPQFRRTVVRRLKSITFPEFIIALVRLSVSSSPMPLKYTAIRNADI